MDYKLICIDMDGTLLNDKKTISERNLSAIRLANKKGVKIAVCTGRIFASADFFSDLLGVKSPVIAANGAYIREKDRDEVVYNEALGVEKCEKLLSVFKKYEIYPHFYTKDMIFTENLTYSTSFYAGVNKTLPKDKQIKVVLVKEWNEIFKKYETEIFKGIGVDEDTEKIRKAKISLRDMDNFEVVSSHFDNFEVTNKGVSKGNAVKILADYYGINREQVICIGDSENDLSMIKIAGLGVAMGNGDGFVKEAAKYITDTNNNDGVAKVIEKFVLEV
ncbi:Cof-type HAD-IIB family hydrolase [Clostridium sp. CM028]|uniref:Cof-type HAD-IIB family hydrolase n=1 Tax=unclassified Clostridium TaxID=2614128 RepID=UPI001C0CD1B3|nr:MULTISPECIES: Cof-type HAD-IIB family hydrolase [unclassified Clostridium]MBU3090803.1 Cof-type HAD-IIB family hydrolase [Clostridium sp. CF011]MBW9144632.1 Cof-type HAD-IIB family hydrolase [Clostridium sp. CM027]MBW9147842.1 Cof-type HAD-IIB family hydrolase [Clostridium sp. CM028]UVE40611.1 Cof-type HAD-IIB family hydrolase [Clostridium sp. CM027]WAG69577.1 Cof-type HAD-IIB family hydrolase [Clostridium sp. CF011]